MNIRAALIAFAAVARAAVAEANERSGATRQVMGVFAHPFSLTPITRC
jgi:hypothetical protein